MNIATHYRATKKLAFSGQRRSPRARGAAFPRPRANYPPTGATRFGHAVCVHVVDDVTYTANGHFAKEPVRRSATGAPSPSVLSSMSMATILARLPFSF